MTSAERIAASLADMLEADRPASDLERAHIASDFMRESLSVPMVHLMVDAGQRTVRATSVADDHAVFRSIWEPLLADDVAVVHASGGRRVAALPHRFEATCFRVNDPTGSLTVALVGDGDTTTGISTSRLAHQVARVTLAKWRSDDDLIRLRTDVARLTNALDSRVVIEQAKGVLAERWVVDPTEAFVRLRRSARATGAPLSTTAAEIVRSIGGVREDR